MENLDDREVQKWMKAKNDRTRAVPASLPGREQLLAHTQELDKSSRRFKRLLPGDLYPCPKLLGATKSTLLSGPESIVEIPV
jgi:hypothetical protein